jgi:CMP-N,N'-diacetyllegionaminic acid synthase
VARRGCRYGGPFSVTGRAGDLLAIIPARGGSRGVPRKNIQMVAGRPLIAWTIDAARSASVVTRIVVSTDSDEIADVARRSGAEVPLMRPRELAEDDTPGIAPVLHTVEWLRHHECYEPLHVVVLQPTSPLRSAADIDAAMALRTRRDAAAVVSVCPTPHHPAWTKSIDAEGYLTNLGGSDDTTPRQQLAPAYVLNGAIYLIRRDVLLERRSLYADRTCAYVMPIERSLDIDSPWDLHIADLVLSARLQERG